MGIKFIKRLVLAWDPDFTKLTPAEKSELEKAESGVYVDSDSIDRDNLGAYAE